MIVAAIASLITVLFLGGPAQIFYVDNLEKGIKKEIVDKERKKEIQAEIKSTKTLNKEFEKQRKQSYKAFLEMYSDINTSSESLNYFFEALQENRAVYQNKLIDQRLIIFKNIEDDEWNNIVASSISVSEKNMEKAEKKASKAKEDFAKTKSKIESTISDEAKKQHLLKGVEDVISARNKLEEKLMSINASQNQILADKNSGKEDLQEILEKDNSIRNDLLESLVSFQGLAKHNCTDAEWSQIFKSFTKEMGMTTR